jgi:DNA-binding PadR family transcriptional regulator
MYLYSYLPKPLAAAEFYVLLILANESSHRYALKARILNASLGSVILSDQHLYKLITKLEHEAFIEPKGPQPAGKSGKLRRYYATTEHLKHALKIGETTGLLENSTPIDIQKLLLGP